MYILILAGLVLAYAGWSLVSLELMARRAAAMKIPFIRVPVDALNPFWLMLEPLVWKFLDPLPIRLPRFTQYMRRGWNFADKANTHLRLGPIYAVVSPTHIYIQVDDPEAINDVFNRRLDFQRPSIMYSTFVLCLCDRLLRRKWATNTLCTHRAPRCVRAMYFNSELGRLATAPQGARLSL